MNKCRILLLVGLYVMTVAVPTVVAQSYDTLRVATYNVLNYPGSTSSSRNPEFRKVLRAIDPDVLIVQEMISSAGVAEFLDQVLNYGQAGTYANAPFSNGPDTDNALFYKPSRVTYLSQIVLETALRDVNGYVLRPVGVSSDSLDFRIYSAHLRSSQGEEAARFAEADTIRNHLNLIGPGHYFVGGDFNLYTSTEPAYQELIESQADNDGRAYDPLNQPGSWHDNSSFAALHTQSPRLTDQGDGGATGGLDDRFDFLLPTYPFQTLPSWQVVPGSYVEYGNDGAHFGQAVNNGTNFSVPDSIADALHASSDHLPVFLDIFRQVTAAPTVTVLTPNGGESYGTGDTLNVTWNTTSYSGSVTISLSRTGVGGPFETLANGTANDGSFKWVTTGSATSQARVKIVLDGAPTYTDVSDNNFTVTQRQINVYTPVAASVIPIGGSVEVNWTATGFSGNVKIELKRSPTSGGWETLSSSWPNSGSFGWTAAGQATDSAVVRVAAVSAPALADSSAMFRIVLPTLTVIRPNGNENFVAGTSEQIQWSHTNLSGTVAIDVNHSYPAGPWTQIATGLAAGGSPYQWSVTGPATATARIRIRSLLLAQVADSSNANFTIIVNNQAPVLGHNQVCDAVPGYVTFACAVTDDGAFTAPQVVWSAEEFANSDSAALGMVSSTLYAGEVAFPEGFYRYFIRLVDAGGLAAQTDTFTLRVAQQCGLMIDYDDGTAESYQWSEHPAYSWAVRFTPPAVPFVLCEAEFALSVRRPDTLHQAVTVTVMSSNGLGGLPGDTLGVFQSGVLSNPLSGAYGNSPGWGRTVLREAGELSTVVGGDFYVAVQGDSTAWALDEDNAVAGRSLVWEPCSSEWLEENGLDPSSRAGHRMIRVRGWAQSPPTVVISAAGNDAVLRWEATGAPHYDVYRSLAPEGPFGTLVGSTNETSLTDSAAISTWPTAFYVVVSRQ